MKKVLPAFSSLPILLVMVLGSCVQPSSSSDSTKVGAQGNPGPSVYVVDATNGNARIYSGATYSLPTVTTAMSLGAKKTYNFQLVNATGAPLAVGTAAAGTGLRESLSYAYDSLWATVISATDTTTSEVNFTAPSVGNLADGGSAAFTVTLTNVSDYYLVSNRRKFTIPVTDNSGATPDTYNFVFEVYGVIVC
jgi:hypothetical protein